MGKSAAAINVADGPSRVLRPSALPFCNAVPQQSQPVAASGGV